MTMKSSVLPRRGISLAALAAIYLGLISATVGISLSNLNYFEGRSEFVGLGNFFQLLGDQSFLVACYLTMKYSVVCTLLTFACSCVWVLIVGHLVLRPIYLIAALAPWFMPPTTVGVIFQLLFDNQQGLIPALLSTFTGASKPDFLGNSVGAFWVAVVADVWQWAGIFGIALALTAKSVPAENIETVAVCGGGLGPQIVAVWIPFLLRPVSALLIFKFFWNIADFDRLSALTSGGGPLGTMRVFGLWIERTYFDFGDFGYGAAAAVAALTLAMLTVPLLLVLIAGRTQ